MPAPPPPPKGRSLRFAAQLAGALLVSVVALGWAFHDADLDKMAAHLERSSPAGVLFFAVGFLVLHFLRVVRWMIHIAALDARVPWRAMFAAANVGISATFFVPLRLGEFVRPVMIQRSGVRFGAAVASVVVERIADGLCSVGLFFAFFPFLPATTPIPDELLRLSRAATVGFVGALIFLVAAALAREPVLGATRRVLGRLSTTLADRVVGLVGTFLDGLAALGSTWRAAAYIGLTVAFWVGNGVITWMLAATYQPELPLVSGLFTISVLVFAVMIPAGPAFAGTFEAGYRLGLGAFGLDASSTIVIAVVSHLVQILMMALILGLGFATTERRRGFRTEGPGAGAAPG